MRHLIGQIESVLVFLIRKSGITNSRGQFLGMVVVLIASIAFNIWVLLLDENHDQRRVIGATQILVHQMKDYEAVLGRQSPLPPHGSPANGTISSPYGMRIHPRSHRWKMHHGIDLAVPVGTSVMVTADGWVSRVGNDPDGWGVFVDVIHPASQYLTRYAHLSKVHVRSGEPVQRGRIIAQSGNSGNSVGAHLHYEIRTATGQSLDPLDMKVP